MILKISVGAFVHTDALKAVLEELATDRMFVRSSIEIQDGTILEGTKFLSTHQTPDLVIVESFATDAQSQSAELDALADVCAPGTRVVLIGAVNDIDLFKALIEQGISQYFYRHASAEGLRDAIYQAFSDRTTQTKGRLISCFGLRGGVGSSSLAHNIAFELARIYDEDVILVDLDIAYGTAALAYNTQPSYTLTDALTQTDRLDETLLQRYLEKCTDNVSLLAAPGNLISGFQINTQTLEKIITLVQQMASFVVLDIPHIWTGWTQDLLVEADETVLVATPDLYNLRDGKNLVEFLVPNRGVDAPTRLIFNKVGASKSGQLNDKDFNDALGVRPVAMVPYEPEIFGKALNNGDMLRTVNAKSKPVSAIEDLAKSLSARQTAKTKKKAGLLDFLSKK